MSETIQSNKVILTDVRASYLYVFQPFKGKNDKGGDTASYTGHFLFLPDSANHKKVQTAICAAATAKWGAKAPDMLKALGAQDRLCLHRGDVSKPGEDAYKGLLYVSANGKKRPTIIDGDRSPLVESDGRPYSGCFVNAVIDVWAQDSSWGKRINAQLAGVQFLRHGEAFGGGRVAAPEEFPVNAADADSDAPAGTEDSGDLV
jgi:hypothetical protein